MADGTTSRASVEHAIAPGTVITIAALARHHVDHAAPPVGQHASHIRARTFRFTGL
jgi:hypothetical protein